MKDLIQRIPKLAERCFSIINHIQTSGRNKGTRKQIEDLMSVRINKVDDLRKLLDKSAIS